MISRLLKPAIILSAVLLLVGCEEPEPTRESDRAALDVQREEIVTFANSCQCTSNSECAYIGLGSKPCGGPWGYIAYSTCVDTQILYMMIDTYNRDEEAYNQRWGIISDCMVVPAPDSVGCLNGVCVKYYNGIPR